MPVNAFGPRHYASHNNQCVQVYDLLMLHNNYLVQVYDLPMDLPMLHHGRLVQVLTYLRTFMLGNGAVVGCIPYAISDAPP
jgi:hypothetical protein